MNECRKSGGETNALDDRLRVWREAWAGTPALRSRRSSLSSLQRFEPPFGSKHRLQEIDVAPTVGTGGDRRQAVLIFAPRPARPRHVGFHIQVEQFENTIAIGPAIDPDRGASVDWWRLHAANSGRHAPTERKLAFRIITLPPFRRASPKPAGRAA